MHRHPPTPTPTPYPPSLTCDMHYPKLATRPRFLWGNTQLQPSVSLHQAYEGSIRLVANAANPNAVCHVLCATLPRRATIACHCHRCDPTVLNTKRSVLLAGMTSRSVICVPSAGMPSRTVRGCRGLKRAWCLSVRAREGGGCCQRKRFLRGAFKHQGCVYKCGR